MPKEMLGWQFGNDSIFDAKIIDDLGNSFEPNIENGKVSNPDTSVIVPPHFDYKILLLFSTYHGVVVEGQIRGIVIKCPICGLFNDVI